MPKILCLMSKTPKRVDLCVCVCVCRGGGGDGGSKEGHSKKTEFHVNINPKIHVFSFWAIIDNFTVKMVMEFPLKKTSHKIPFTSLRHFINEHLVRVVKRHVQTNQRTNTMT